jgi:adenosylhomocysteinase
VCCTAFRCDKTYDESLLMDYQSRVRLNSYYDALRSAFPLTQDDAADNLTIIAVTHFVPDAELLLDAIVKIAPVVVLPKYSVANPLARQRIDARFPIVSPDRLLKTKPVVAASEFVAQGSSLREAMLRTEFTKELIKTYVPAGHRFMILDVGGYFAPTLQELLQDSTYARRLVGISEGTKNGEAKYNNVVAKVNVPIFSRAWDRTKLPENYLVGTGCVKAIDALLIALAGSPLTKDRRIGLIGFGDVGEPLARSLISKGMDVLVYDTDPLALIRAVANHCNIARDKYTLLEESDVIILASGNKSISIGDLGKMRDGAILACVTSIDDEVMEHNQLKKLPYEDTINNGNTVNRTLKVDGRSIHLLLAGKSVNFYMGIGTAHPVTYLAIGSWIAHIATILNKSDELAEQIRADQIGGTRNYFRELDHGSQLRVADVWLDYYANVENKPGSSDVY